MSQDYVLVVGSVNADIVIEVNALPKRGETIAARTNDTGVFYPGGKGANQAAAVSRALGKITDCKFIGQFGHDEHGKALEVALQEYGVDTTLSGHPTCPSGQAFVFVYPDGENSIIVTGGANVQWPPGELSDSIVSAICSASIVLLQSEIPHEVNVKIAKACQEAEIPVMWDTGGEDRQLDENTLPLINILCPNESELARLTKMPVTRKEEAIEAAHSLQKIGARNILVTLGTIGSIFVPEAYSNENSDVIFQASYPIEKVVDTTGAGDCYRACFAAAFAQGKSIEQCMAFATAASALCVQTTGAMVSMPTIDEIEQFLYALGSS